MADSQSPRTFWTVVEECLRHGEPTTHTHALPTWVIYGWVSSLPDMTVEGVRAALGQTDVGTELPGYSWRRQGEDAWVFTRTATRDGVESSSES